MKYLQAIIPEPDDGLTCEKLDEVIDSHRRAGGCVDLIILDEPRLLELMRDVPDYLHFFGEGRFRGLYTATYKGIVVIGPYTFALAMALGPGDVSRPAQLMISLTIGDEQT